MVMKNNKGFTLIEIIAVLLLIAIIASITFVRLDSLGPNAAAIVSSQMISDMNIAALSGWTSAKFTNEGWISDENVRKFESYSNFPLDDSNFLTINSYQVKVKRHPSQLDTPARWERD